MDSRIKNLILLTQKYPFERGEEFLERELFYLAKSYKNIYLIPTGVRDFSKQRDIPENVKIVKIANPETLGDILKGFIKNLPIFPSLFYTELKQTKLNGDVFKYLLYHIPFALTIKEQIKKLVLPGQNYSFYSYWMDTNAYALALLKKENPSYKFFIRSHGGDLYNERHSTNSILFREVVYEQVSLIAPVSANGTSYLRKNWPQYSHKIKTFCLGVEKQLLGPIETKNLHRIISCSSIIPLKRLEKILEVIKLLPMDIEWIHFGGTEIEINRLKNLAKDNFLPGTKFIPKGHTNHDELIAFYQSTPCDLFINLSESEGIPVSIMEAISFGIPVLSNDVGGINEIVTDQTGILVNKEDSPKVIAQKIELFFKSGNSRSEIFRLKVQQFWDANFNEKRNFASFMNEIGKYTCIAGADDAVR